MQPTPMMVPVMIPPARAIMIMEQMGHFTVVSHGTADEVVSLLEGALVEVKNALAQAQDPTPAPIALTVVPKTGDTPEAAPATEPAPEAAEPMQSTPAPMTDAAEAPTHDDPAQN